MASSAIGRFAAALPVAPIRLVAGEPLGSWLLVPTESTLLAA